MNGDAGTDAVDGLAAPVLNAFDAMLKLFQEEKDNGFLLTHIDINPIRGCRLKLHKQEINFC